MRFTLSWLKEHLDTTASLSEITDKLTSLGLVVDKVIDRTEELAPFTICQIVDTEMHPKADRLKICRVNTGTEELQIVCGGANASKGMKGVLAPVGAIIPETKQKLKVGKVRDVESFGMLCSGEELLLEPTPEGILILDEGAPVGENFAAWAGLDDPFIEIEITPNRGDCLGVYGVARDLAAAGLGALKPLTSVILPGKFPSPASLELNENACPFFSGRLIRGVKNGPSPEWLQKKLKSIGLRPISTLVDITNYFTFDRGRPLHVFDADKLKGNLNIRFSKERETFAALDEKTYTLPEGLTVISDDTEIVSLGGIMGGQNSGCDESTQNVFLECAFFDAVQIAVAGQVLGIISDSRYRFERGVDPNTTLPGLETATQMILDLCGGEPSEVVTAGNIPSKEREISYQPQLVEKLGGLEVNEVRQKEILTNLGFNVEVPGDKWRVVSPSWRPDVEQPSDLVEEILRVEGYEKIPSLPYHGRPIAKPLDRLQQRRFVARDVLANCGLYETVTYSFMSEKEGQYFGGISEDMILLNPLSQDLNGMRPSVLVHLLDAVRNNQARGEEQVHLFEIGPQFSANYKSRQNMVVAGVRAGSFGENCHQKSRPVDIYDVKADIARLFDIIGMSYHWDRTAPSWYHPGRSAVMKLGKLVLGYFGEIHPRVLKAFDIKGPVVAFELFIDDIPLPRRKGTQKPKYEVSPYQGVERDFSFVVDRDVTSDDIILAAVENNKQFLISTNVFDVFEMENNQKAVGIRFGLQARDHTLTEQEIQGFSDKAIAQVEKATGGVLR